MSAQCKWKSTHMLVCGGAFAVDRIRKSTQEHLNTRFRWTLLMLSVVAVFASLSVTARPQSISDPGNTDGPAATTISDPPDLTYVRPTHGTKARNYLFDAYGPYPIVGAAAAAGINQITRTPPEWRQGAEGFGKRFGSDFAIAAIATTTRFGMAEALKEDTLYYRCACSGVWPRLGHAVTSTFTARRGVDGHRVFSLPALLAPYAGTAAAVYGWYPDRFGAKDVFRMGNYSVLAYVGGSIALEFVYGGPHSLLSHMHTHKRHSSADQEPGL
jgi:hypothetical protein